MAGMPASFFQLFSRSDDQQFATFDALYSHCLNRQRNSEVHWRLPAEVIPTDYHGKLRLKLTGSRAFGLTDWSFGQVCQFAGLKKESLNRLKSSTAAQVLLETMPHGSRALQIFTEGETIRSIHPVGYNRIHDSALLELVIEEAFDFDPPHVGDSGATGLYAGEQDMFVFMIDPKAWIEVGDDRFAPGFLAWNSEVGRRAIGLATFWYQRACGNHLIWDANTRVSYSRKHNAQVETALENIRQLMRRVVDSSSARKDAFAKALACAQRTKLGSCSEEVIKVLRSCGIGVSYVRPAVAAMADKSDGYTVYNVVDSLTRLTGRLVNAGDRFAQDSKIGQLLALAN